MHLRPLLRQWAFWSENEVCSGALLARCYFEATEIDCAIDQLKPGLKSEIIFVLLFKERVSNMHLYVGAQRVYILLITNTGKRSSTQTCQILKIKGFLSGEAFSLSACKFHHVNSESAMVQAQLVFRVSSPIPFDWFIACYAQNTPITH